MGIPPTYQIEFLNDPRMPYQYAAYCGWAKNDDGCYVSHAWLDYFRDTHGHGGELYGASWYYNNLVRKIYFKEQDYPFFMLKFGHMFNKRPWEY